ncbi:CDP-glycerol glycerophosphotransferase family protein [Leuconostoc mesenteroides subsp. jonggajibkimchii]|uniref:CDP-glycerol glycerophosphotransferase family protein n=1 Tax=Leuconostoc mesenteroides TaxID=1245 RepID=UPI003CF648A6
MYIKNRKDNYFSEVQDNYKIAQLATKINWQPVYSDAYNLKNGEYQRYRLNIWQFFVLFFFSYKFQVKMPNNMVWYPFATKKGYLSFSYRSDNGFSPAMRRKQWLGMIVGGVVNLIQPFNRPQLAFEKLSERAQESGFAYFKYVQEHYPKERLYFIIKRDAPDYAKLKAMQRVVIHGSFQHFYLLHRASLFVSSETPGHAYFWRENMGLTANVVRIKPYVFLQHGVLGFKKLDNIFYGDRLTAPSLLITSSLFEQNIVTSQLDYDAKRAPITGLARWDMIDLMQERLNNQDKILVFYTWRPWLDDISDESFRASQYFQHIKATLTILSNYDDKQVILMMHPKLHATLDQSLLSKVKLWTDNDGPMNELLSSVATVITDYSSISWEAYYREIPVIFDMFDQARYADEVGSYIDLDELPFGVKVTQDKHLQVTLSEIAERHYQLTSKELADKTKYFAFQDQGASERIHRQIMALNMKAIKRTKRHALMSAMFRVLHR